MQNSFSFKQLFKVLVYVFALIDSYIQIRSFIFFKRHLVQASGDECHLVQWTQYFFLRDRFSVN